MSKYRLKDQELQRHLDAISDGDFSRQIEGHLSKTILLDTDDE